MNGSERQGLFLNLGFMFSWICWKLASPSYPHVSAHLRSGIGRVGWLLGLLGRQWYPNLGLHDCTASAINHWAILPAFCIQALNCLVSKAFLFIPATVWQTAGHYFLVLFLRHIPFSPSTWIIHLSSMCISSEVQVFLARGECNHFSI